ncbi:MAG TPA: cupin domain-containing protein [Rhodocyclaceae bacterium]|nr:cupin domain-containing protein [Rhodocyclaceae bacterium]
MSTSMAPTRKPVVLAPGEGRAYPMGRISAVFKADEAETDSRYSVSEWWLEPRTQGPGPHSHAEDDLFYIIEGTMSVLVGEKWVEADKGAFVLIPGGVTHDFQNRGSVRAGLLNFSTPGPFEPEMPGIAEWFAKNPPQDTGT